MENRIFLFGMPGSGKTTLGKKLSNQLDLPFFDLDDIIVKSSGKSINQIFKESGEETFREIETSNLIKFLETHDRFILATGGGTPCYNNNLSILVKNGISIYLNVSLNELFNRLKSKIAHRPLLKDKSEEELLAEISEKLETRKSFYNQANFVIADDNIRVEALLKILKEKAD